MAILNGSLKVEDSEEELVFSEDPDAGVPDELKGCGWIPAELCAPKKGADRVRQRAPNADQKTAYRDRHANHGEATAHRYMVTATVVQVNKRKKPSELREWTDALARMNWRAHDLLSMRALARAAGTDLKLLYPAARILLGYEDAVPDKAPGAGDDGSPDEEGVTDGGPKSADDGAATA